MSIEKKLIFDIETVGDDFDKLDKATQDNLTRWIKRDAADEREYEAALEYLKNGLGFSPLTGQIVAIGLLDYDKNQGAVYYQAPGSVQEESIEEEGMTFKAMSEPEMLKKFWEVTQECGTFITFNGRGFDVPFLMVRSAIHSIRATKDLMSNRYLNSQKFGARHIDLMDQLSFYGAARRSSLHLWARAMGITSPKAGGVTGDDVGPLFKNKKYLEIAKYNAGDLLATRALYEKWRDYLSF